MFQMSGVLTAEKKIVRGGYMMIIYLSCLFYEKLIRETEIVRTNYGTQKLTKWEG